MGLGLESAYGAGGAADALRQLLRDRFERQQALHDNSIHDQQIANQTRSLDQNDALRRDALTEATRQHDLAAGHQTFEENLALNEAVPQGTQLPATSPIAGRLMAMGSLKPQGINAATPPALAANPNASDEVSGTVANSPSVTGRIFTKTATAKQQSTEDKSALAQAGLDLKTQTSQAAIDAKVQELTNAAQRLEMQGKVNEANILRTQAQTELDKAKTAHVGDAKPLPSTTADQMAGLNVAEVEGVKVLKGLHEAGLDQSNNLADPRWQKFMVTTLKMAPGDWNKADIQQRTAAVNAMLTRGLMGARPSQYVAQLIQQHLPQGDMTGKQLSHVIHNVLEQAGERRIEVESLTGREQGSLNPKSGMTYRQFLDSGGGVTPSASTELPPGVTVTKRKQ